MNLENISFYTDYYQLTMAQGHFLTGKYKDIGYYDYYFRTLPFKGGYVVFSGLSTFIELLNIFKFNNQQIDYLSKKGFHDSFLDYLKGFKFTGDIKSVKEGEIVFANEPLVSVSAPIIEAQIIETMLLNIFNFESLIATKARRIKYASNNKFIMEFGLRRAQGFGALQASKASFIGGIDATSNILVGYENNLPVSGTMAHAWIQSFDNELDAFRTYSELYSDSTTLLLDTYSTLESGLPNAILIAKELESKGKKLNAVRLDSGDLTYLSNEIRKKLNDNNLEYVKIIATNELDEYSINELENNGSKIDAYGVGTRLVVAKDQPALGGVYKLVQLNNQPKIKISEDKNKITLPANKSLYRNHNFDHDLITLEGEMVDNQLYENLHTNIIKNGQLVKPLPNIQETISYANEKFNQLDNKYKELHTSEVYKISNSFRLNELKEQLLNEYK